MREKMREIVVVILLMAIVGVPTSNCFAIVAASRPLGISTEKGNLILNMGKNYKGEREEHKYLIERYQATIIKKRADGKFDIVIHQKGTVWTENLKYIYIMFGNMIGDLKRIIQVKSLVSESENENVWSQEPKTQINFSKFGENVKFGILVIYEF